MLHPISFCSRLRIYVARLLVLTSILDIVEFIFLRVQQPEEVSLEGGYVILLPLFVVLAVHHLLAVFGPWKLLINAIDITLLVVEIIVFAYISMREYRGSVVFDLPIGFSPRVAALFCLFIDRLVMAVLEGRRLGFRYFIKPLKLIPDRERALLTKWQILYGRRLLSAHLLGETKWIIFPRFILASTILFFIIGYAYYTILIQPFTSNQIWSRQITTWGLEDDLQGGYLSGNNTVALTLTFTPPFCDRGGSEGDRYASIEYQSSEEDLQPAASCIKQEGRCSFFRCPFVPSERTPSSNTTATSTSTLVAHSHEDALSTIPEILVAYDFSSPQGPRKEVYVHLGMTEDPLYLGIQPIRITRGVHDVVSYQIDFREEIPDRSMGSLWGLFQPDTDRVAYVREISRSHDATRNMSTAGPNIGSIRLVRSPQSMWILHQQTIKKDATDGLSSVGGFWTLLNGVFLIICGRGLLDILIGQRPLSAVGLLHLFSQRRIREEAAASYPRLEEDRDHRGLPALIVDHFADMDPFVAGKAGDREEDAERDSDSTGRASMDSEKAPHESETEKGALLEGDAVVHRMTG